MTSKSRLKNKLLRWVFAGLVCSAIGSNSQAGEATFNFDSDEGLAITTNLPDPPGARRDTGGQSGGYLAISDAAGSQSTAILFPDFDAGAIVSAFRFSADVRIGNGLTDRGADGFSISYARSNDPLLTDSLSNANFAGTVPEAGSTTGLAISFDAWSGNALPDGADIEGVIIRVDNETVLRFGMPTRHGSADDVTSLQTGPLDPSDARTGSPDGLGWVPLEVELNEDGQLSVSWKGTTILDRFQTEFFPSPGRLILAGRTGGANQNQHIDNLSITTIASANALLTGFSHSPNGLSLEFTDGSTGAVDPSTLVLTVDGNLIPSDQIETTDVGLFGTRFFWASPERFPSGSLHTMTASVSDGSPDPILVDREFTTLDYATIPAAFAVAESDIDLTRPGFRVRNYQVASSSTTIQWAEDTLNGKNGDDLLPQNFGSDINNDGDITNDNATRDGQGFWYEPNQINYDEAGGGTGTGRFFDANFIDPILSDHPLPGLDIFSGVPVPDNLAMEIVTYVYFPEARVYTMVVNSDDGFKVSTAPNIHDQLGLILGAFNGGRGSSDTPFAFAILEPGYYPMRLVWFEGGGGANLEWYMNNEDGTRDLINGDIAEDALASYPFATGSQNHAYVGDNTLQSLIGGATLPLTPSFSVEVIDGIETVDPASVSLTLNGSAEGVAVTKTGGTTSVVLSNPPLLPSGADVEVTFSYAAGGETYSTTLNATAGTFSTVGTGLMTALGTGDASQPGFNWSVYQVAAGGGTSIALNEQVLAGEIGANVADLTNADDGNTFYIDIVNFNQDAPGGESGNFTSLALEPLNTPDAPLPGIPSIDPNATAPTDNIAAEALTYIEFPTAGFYQMGVNSDDGFLVSIATAELGFNPANPYQRLGEFDNGRGAADTLFDFNVTEAGVYPIRLLWFEGGGGANVEWFSVDADGNRFLINENRAGALKAYRARTATPGVPPLLSPDNPVVATSDNSPAGEPAEFAIDGNDQTKYLNFDAGVDNGSQVTGLTVTPGGSIVTGIRLTSANDSPNRDPATYRLSGSTDGGVTFTLISEGDVPAFADRFTTVEVSFANTVGYITYQVLFPTTVGPDQNSMQIAEIQLLGERDGGVRPTSPPADLEIVDGLIAHWAFDGDYNDSNGVFNGEARGTVAPVFVPGAFGQAVLLDGEDQFVEITGGDENNLEFPGGDMTISAWFRVDAFDTNWQALLSKGEGTNYRIARRGDTDFIGYAGGVGEPAQAGPNVNDGAWHHVVAISNSAFSTQLWIDGILYEESAAAPVLAESDFNLFIGDNPGSTGREWEGGIDDVAIWNRVLSEEEIGQLANNSLNSLINPIDTGLVAYWAFDDNYDDSNGVFNGEARGSVAPVFVPGAFGSAVSLDGEDQFVEITGGDENDLEFPGADMSISAWFRVSAFDTNWQALLSKGEGENYRIARRGDTDFIGYAGGVGEPAQAGPNVNDGAWHHVAAISNSATSTQLWIDGILYEESATAPVLAESDFNLFIGENPGSTGREWEGDIDDVAIWNRVLNEEEIVRLAGNSLGNIIAGIAPPASALVGIADNGDGTVTITWTGSLRSASTVDGPYTDEAGTSPMTITPTEAARFYLAQ